MWYSVIGNCPVCGRYTTYVPGNGACSVCLEKKNRKEEAEEKEGETVHDAI